MLRTRSQPLILSGIGRVPEAKKKSLFEITATTLPFLIFHWVFCSLFSFFREETFRVLLLCLFRAKCLVSCWLSLWEGWRHVLYLDPYMGPLFSTPLLLSPALPHLPLPGLQSPMEIPLRREISSYVVPLFKTLR